MERWWTKRSALLRVKDSESGQTESRRIFVFEGELILSWIKVSNSAES